MITYFAGPICTGLECWGILGILVLILIGPFIISGILIALGVYLVSGKKTPGASSPVNLRKTVGIGALIVAAFIITTAGYRLGKDAQDQRESQKALQEYSAKKEVAAKKRDSLRSAFQKSGRAIYTIPDEAHRVQVSIDGEDTSAMATTRYTADPESKQVHFAFHHFLGTPRDSEAVFKSVLTFTGTDDNYHNNCQEAACTLIAKNEKFEIKRVNEVLPPENLYEVMIDGQVILISAEAGTSSSAAYNKTISQKVDQQIAHLVGQLQPIDKTAALFLQL